MHRPPSRQLAACVLAVCASARLARASPADNPATDGAVFAGVTSPEPANLSTNPSTLLRMVPGLHMFATSTVGYERVSIDRRLASPDDGALSAGPSVDGGNVGAGVTAGLAGVSTRTVIAASVGVPPPDETIEDDAVAYHTRGTRTRRLDWLRAGAGVRLTSRFFFGFSLGFVRRTQHVAFARDTALEAGRDPARGVGSDCGGMMCGLENPAARELWTIDAATDFWDQRNLSYTFGVMARLPSDVWIGLALERPWEFGKVAIDGEAVIVRAPRDGGGTLPGEAQLIQRLPEVWRLGGRGPIAPGWELIGELRWRHLSRTDPLDVRVFGGALIGTDVPEWTLRPMGLRDAFAGELGVEPIDRGQRWRLGARIGVDSGAVAADRLSPRAPWGSQIMLSLGAQVRLDRWVLQLGYRLEAQLPTSSEPSAFDPLDRIDCVEADYEYDDDACAAVRAGYGTSTAAGTYGRQAHTARVALRVLLR